MVPSFLRPICSRRNDSEIGLYDTEGDIVCIKTFSRKGKDDDAEQTFVLNDVF